MKVVRSFIKHTHLYKNDLLEGRFHLLQDWIFDLLLQDKTSVTAFDRKVYGDAYKSRASIKASNAWYQAFSEDIQDIKKMQTISVPALGIASEGSYEMLKMNLPSYINNLKVEVVNNSGHFIQEEQPEQTASLILEFLKN